MPTTLHILVSGHNVVGWLVAWAYLHENTSNHYYLESSGQVAYMETNPKHTNANFHVVTLLVKLFIMFFVSYT